MNKKEKIELDVEVRPRRWLLMVLISIALIIVIILISKVVEDRKKIAKEEKGLFNNFSDKAFYDVQDRISKAAFNSVFEMYNGTEYGSSVSQLLDEVITNNKTNQNRLIEVIFKDVKTSDTTKIKDLKKLCGNFDRFEISLDYNAEGYVKLITIEKYEDAVVGQIDTPSVDAFMFD